MSTILITGAGGYIGSIACQLFLSLGHKVIGVDAFFTGYKSPLDLLQSQYPNTFVWYEANIANQVTMAEIFQKHNDIQAVVHYAGSCVVRESITNPEKYFDNNVHSALLLLESMHKYGVRNLVFSSTCTVYGNAQYSPIDELHPLNPSNPYGESKLMVEQMIRWYAKLHKFNAIVMRYFNVYGTSDDAKFGYAKKPCTHLVDAAVQGALGINSFNLTCNNQFATPDGTPIRDYLHVLDLNDAHVRAVNLLLSTKVPVYETINLGTGTGNTVLEIVETIEKVMNVNLPRSVSEVREGEDATLVADNRKAKAILDWCPTRKIVESLPTMITWYKAHPKGWEE